MQRILKKLQQQIDNHNHNSHSNHSTTSTTTSTAITTSTTTTINHLNKTKLDHDSHYCSKRTNDYREQLWCEFAFKTFTLATNHIKNNILSYHEHNVAAVAVGVLNI